MAIRGTSNAAALSSGRAKGSVIPSRDDSQQRFPHLTYRSGRRAAFSSSGLLGRQGRAGPPRSPAADGLRWPGSHRLRPLRRAPRARPGSLLARAVPLLASARPPPAAGADTALCYVGKPCLALGALQVMCDKFRSGYVLKVS